ncbi:larval cuticle protein LCP-30-like [Aricia agestis]|uniref:larval cuticle protein LCP-30-like n=1 Tax=Aricia agestis TaxID=91739 RepID=UPI001C2073B3|nr:larval cuticle protein LCP-30-like [Aricia agestis]
MKSILLFALTLCVIALARAEDDGKYRAERYVSDGRYFNNYNGRYDNGYRRFYGNNYNNGWNQQYPGWNQPYPYNARPYSDLLAPFASSGKDNSAADNAVVKPKAIEVKPAVTIIAPTTAAPRILPAVVSTTALPRVAYAKFGNEGQARIVSQDSDTEANGYNYSFRTENGINVGETGLVDAANSGGTRVKGFYEYVGDDGLVYRVDYTADENGFHATGAHLP